ncbi:DUF1684 domain-containing protein [Streptomyces profundus]|uniref:DUF1684 domain-containing protein n=1 Tax=Streptomyces profundus TaxID=2867410 RepID=UPI001D164CDB|nr:DUF1684 domain-containing protein [Streptomyces sp. MA3_2.13]UED86605.1 DUF1684 domain-containing protein [Streptomyces sp. MA3_2.13]
MTIPETAPDAADRAAFEAAWRQWRAQRDRTLTAPHGFLAVTSLRWLGPAPERFEDAPGAWSSTEHEGVVVELAADEQLTLDGESLVGRHVFGHLPERGGVTAEAGDTLLEIARRGGQDILRPRHPEHPLRTGYTGTPSYAPDPAWVLPGRFVPFDEPRSVTVGAAVPGLEHVYQAPGAVEFDVDGERHRLTAFNGGAPGALLLLFTDATSGVTTYPASRSLALDPPDAAGRVTVDLNRAANLPCAYTDHATCPLPPAGNRLPVAVEAGERLPLERGGAPD